MKVVAVLLVFTLFVAVVYGVFTATVSIQNEFTVVAGLATSIPTLKWGNVSIGGTYTKTVQVSNLDVAHSFTLTMTHLLPVSVGTLSWDREGYTLLIGESVVCTFTLTVSTSPSIIGYNTPFGIVITGTGI